MSEIKVLFLAGLGRSGTTLLANLLGQLEGYLCLGEMRHIWDRGILENRRCGCGEFFSDCDLWRRIFSRAGGFDAELAEEMRRARDSTIRTRHLPLVSLGFGRERVARRAKRPVEVLRELYAAVLRETGCRVIVDSSKSPADAYLLGMVPGIELYVVHVVRDPRAVAYSWWSRAKQTRDSVGDAFLPRYNPVRISALWDLWNILIPALCRSRPYRYMLIGYESFVRSPRETIRSISEFVRQPVERLPFTDDGKATVSPCHTVSGNPDRFTHGLLDITVDEEWKREMSPLARATVSALTFPLRARFGYGA